MTTPFFLIDFENVQPIALGRLQPGTARIKVFLGQHQSKLMLELVQALQPFGKDAEYIQIQGSGPDAVDFHIAFYIGRLEASHPGSSFTIVSKDRGFDPLVKHLGTLGIACKRLPEIPDTQVGAVATPAKAKPVKQTQAKKATKKLTIIVDPPSPAAVKPTIVPTKTVKPATAQATTAKARATLVVAGLLKASKPATVATLRSTIRARFNPALDDKQVDAVIQSLKDSKKIVVVGTKVTYAL